ncbi:virion structural protein [Vibrio phage C-ZP2022]|nr:virion structural protein [Vibrio phage C-ZP2022]
MSLTNFVTRVFTPTEKEIVVKGLEQNIDNHEGMLEEILMVDDRAYADLAVYKMIDTTLRRSSFTGDIYKGNVLQFLRLTVKELAKNKNDYLKMLEKSFDREVIREGLDYHRVHLLQMCAAIDTFFDFATKFAAVLSANASSDLYKKDKIIMKYEEEINNYGFQQAAFYGIMIAHKRPSQLESAFAQGKDVPFIEERAKEMEAAYKEKVDPFRSNLIPVIGHIAIFVGEYWNSWITYRRDRAKEILNRIRMEQLYRKRAMEGATGEELENIKKQIEHYDKRIRILEQKIKDMES